MDFYKIEASECAEFSILTGVINTRIIRMTFARGKAANEWDFICLIECETV